MEVSVLEDPACCWCWAFQPVETALLFEFGEDLKIRRVMGGLRDQPFPDVDFARSQWDTAQRVSDMPFTSTVWKKHVLRTTFVACRAVKAASIVDPRLAGLFLRRIREAFYVEETPVDSFDRLFPLALEVGLDVDQMLEHIESGRAEAIFQRDRMESANHGFGFPTLVVKASRQQAPIVLLGAVPYHDVVDAFLSVGFPPERRRRFRDHPDDWRRLFELRPRLTLAELVLVTRMEARSLEARLDDLGATRSGVFAGLPQHGAEARAPLSPPLPPPFAVPAPARAGILEPARSAATIGAPVHESL